MIIHILFSPFIDYSFMRRAMIACFLLSISITPIGGLLVLRRMNLLIGDALSHAILPGVVVGYLFFDMSFFAMILGGFFSGLIVVFLSKWISEKREFLREDISFSGLYLGFLALGIILLSVYGSDIDLLNLLFGSVITIGIQNLKFIGIVSFFTILIIVFLYRLLIIEAFDPDFIKNINFKYFKLIQMLFLSLIVLNLVASFQIVGTLMSLGLMILPSLIARCWVFNNLKRFLFLSIFISIFCSWIGLLGSFYLSFPPGPTIILCSNIIFLISIFFGKYRLYKKVFSFINF